MVKVEVEIENKSQLLEAIEAGADVIMFDNCSPEVIKDWIPLVPAHVVTEASGGITLGTLSSFRDSGVDYISLGALTHSAGSIDISLDLLTERGTENDEFITNASAKKRRPLNIRSSQKMK